MQRQWNVPARLSAESKPIDELTATLQEQSRIAAQNIRMLGMRQLEARGTADLAEIDARRATAEALRREADSRLQTLSATEKPPFEVKGSVDLGHFDIQAMLQTERDALKGLQEENIRLREETSRKEIEGLNKRLDILSSSGGQGTSLVASWREMLTFMKEMGTGLGLQNGGAQLDVDAQERLENLKQANIIALKELELKGVDLSLKWGFEKEKWVSEREERKEERAAKAQQHSDMMSTLGDLVSSLGGLADEKGAQVPRLVNVQCSGPDCDYKFPIKYGRTSARCPKCHRDQSISYEEEAQVVPPPGMVKTEAQAAPLPQEANETAIPAD